MVHRGTAIVVERGGLGDTYGEQPLWSRGEFLVVHRGTTIVVERGGLGDFTYIDLIMVVLLP